MEAYERRLAIWHTLCRQGKATTAALAAEYNVSSRTIRTDIDMLSRIYPIVTKMGRNGCIMLADWTETYNLLLTPKELDLLHRLQHTLDQQDAHIMSSIITKVTSLSLHSV